MKLNSYTITQGRDRAPARSYLKAIGFTDEDLKKPIIGVANTWTETMNCNYKLRDLAVHVKEGIRAAGGTPMEFNTIAISDGITMGTEGMKASLVSREVIADSIELVARGHMFDGIVALVACDKTIPGAGMALLRLNIPGVILYGGSILPGRITGTTSPFRMSSKPSAPMPPGKMSRRRTARNREPRLPRRGRVRRPVHRQHHGHRDGTDRPLADGHGRGAAGGYAQGRRGAPLRRSHHELRAQEHPAARHLPRARRSTTPSRAWRRPAAPPTPCCTCSPWRAKPECELKIDDFQTISERTPLFVDLKPGGKYVAVDVDKAGGIGVIAQRLVEGKYVDGSALTCTGRTFGEEAAKAVETPGQEVIRPLDKPLKPTGGLAILRGSLAPEGCVIKLAGHNKRKHQRSGARLRSRRRRHGGRERRQDQAERRGGDPL